MKIKELSYTGNCKLNLHKADTQVPLLYSDKADYEAKMSELQQKMDELQSMMYAHSRYGLLIIFQAMDAAGKDSTIKHVFSGVNPFGVKTYNFKRPSETELHHDFLWRTNACLPERGTMAIFNRSYYEEVLVVKVHPEIVQNVQRLPSELTQDLDKLWQKRYEDIVNLERYLYHNGQRVIKFFLNVSKKEQGKRLIERIEDPTKNWKFEEADVKERALWHEYQQAYEEAINATASEKAPWYVIPADDKKNMRLMVASIINAHLADLDMNYPEADINRQNALKGLIEVIKGQDD